MVLLARSFVVVLSVLVIGCWEEQPRRRADLATPGSPAIDSFQVASPEETARWPFRREDAADLDGDGTAERILLLADQRIARPAAIGDSSSATEGRRWAVVIEDSAGRRTLAYGALLADGGVELAVLRRRDDGRRSLLVLERTSEHVRDLEIGYADGRPEPRSSVRYEVDSWIAREK